MADRPILKLKMPKAKTKPDPTVPPSGTKLKLNFAGLKKQSGAAPESPSATASPKIKLSMGNKKKPGALNGKASGKTAKVGKKREREGADAAPASAGIKRIKLTSKQPGSAKTPTTPFFKLKAKGKPPVRPQGIGYDSEASDAEEDPHIEEEFILRMQPGEDCDYVRDAIANKTIGKRLAEGGADVRLKFLRADGRRAVLHVRGNMYGAGIVDLPCVVEGMKSWDKKGWWKTADICQMLLVLGPVKNEEEASNLAYPNGDVREGTYMYEHGLTPPMAHARKRRFRKRVSTSIVMQVEQEVDDLFRRDAEAISSSCKMQTIEEANEEKRQEQMEEMMEEDMEEDTERDAEGEDDMIEAYDPEPDEVDADTWEALFDEVEAEPISQVQSQAGTPAPQGDANAANTDSDAATPATITAVVDADEQAGTPAGQDDAEESGSDADEDDEDEEADEEQLETQRQRDEIAEIESAIKQKQDALAGIKNALLVKKQNVIINDLKQQLALKKAAIGEADED